MTQYNSSLPFGGTKGKIPVAHSNNVQPTDHRSHSSFVYDKTVVFRAKLAVEYSFYKTKHIGVTSSNSNEIFDLDTCMELQATIQVLFEYTTTEF